jgi:hypothetical protein
MFSYFIYLINFLTPLPHNACNSWTTPGGVVLTQSTVLIDHVAVSANGCPSQQTINFTLDDTQTPCV